MAFQPNTGLNRAVGDGGKLSTQTWHEVDSLAFTDSRVLRKVDIEADVAHRAHWTWKFPALALHSSASKGEITIRTKAHAHATRQRTEMHVRFSKPTSVTGIQACGIGSMRHGCFLVYRQDVEGVNHFEVWLFRNYEQHVYPQKDWVKAHLSQWKDGAAVHETPLRARFDMDWPHWCNISIMDNRSMAFQRVLRLSANTFSDGFVLYSRNLPAMAHVGQSQESQADVVMHVMSITLWKANGDMDQHGTPVALDDVLTVKTTPTVAMCIRNRAAGKSGVDTAWGTKQQLVNDVIMRPTSIWVTPHRRNNVLTVRVFRNLDLMWTGDKAPTWSDVSFMGQGSTVHEVFNVKNNLHLIMTSTALIDCTACCLVLKSLPGLIRSPSSWTVRIHKGGERSDIQETAQLVSIEAYNPTGAGGNGKKKQQIDESVRLTVNRLSRIPEQGDLVELINGHQLFCQSTNDSNMHVDTRASHLQLKDGETLSVILTLLSGSMKGALLSHKILTHNPFMSRKVTNSLLVQCFRVVCMSDVANHILTLSKTVMHNVTSSQATVPPPILRLGLKVETIVQFLFTELDDIAAWLRPDQLTPVRMQRVFEFLTERTEKMRQLLAMSKERTAAFRQSAVVRFDPESAKRHGEDMDGWRCTCECCRGWANLTEADWTAFCACMRRDFPWFQNILRVEEQYRENLKTLQQVPQHKIDEITKKLGIHEKLQTAVREVKTGTIERGDSALDDYLIAIKEAASEVDRADADVAIEM